MSETPIPIKDILTDPAHPLCDATKDMLDRLAKGEISMCACLGPMYGEPKCPCAMEREGLPLNVEAREASRKRAEEQMKALFGPGGEYYQPDDGEPTADAGGEG